jgi:(p)ppGpp synthase/HD superfamily hydrolase
MSTSINIARSIAEKVHLEPNKKYPKGQKDKKGFPYMSHINDIANRVAHHGKQYEIVGLLHDAIEDAHSNKARAEVEKLIKNNFEQEVIDAVYAMTKTFGEDYFEDYLPRLKKNKIALKVKIADSSHNLSKAHLIENNDLQEKLRQKYIMVLNFLGVDGNHQEKPIIFTKGKWVEKK